jgi:hypothetical protein
MVATVRPYEDIHKVRSEVETSTVGTRPLPALRKLPGFSGCYVFDEEHDPESDANRSGRLS